MKIDIKKIVIGLVILGLVISFPFLFNNAKQGKDTDATSKGDTTETASDDDKGEDEQVQIGILQLVSHPALDAIAQGIYDGLAEAGYKNGEKASIDLENAQGDQGNLATMTQTLIAKDPDVLVGITTPAAQTLANAEKTTPVIMSAVTYPEEAGLVASENKPGGNVTGVSDRTPVKEQIAQIKEVLPDAETIGVLYTASEDNAATQAKEAEQAIEELGLKSETKTVSNTTDLQQISEQLASQVDAIYVPIDNGIASAMVTLVNVTDSYKIPVFPSADTMVKDGGFMGLGVDQYGVGKQTAEVIVDILKGEKPSDYPIKITTATTTYVNEEKAKELGITIPDDLLKDAEIVVPSEEGGN
ncbi:MAG: tryptophan ABC transporter substrate-binding protein [Bavariicoccus seileri]|uniref:tryptophan ABC transporter substrate-binding protein n=1 Tax=Bavariicoccus seileri TaxID=549685 RepID=UPI003F974FED